MRDGTQSDISCRKAGLFFTMHGSTPSVHSPTHLSTLSQLFSYLFPLTEVFETWDTMRAMQSIRPLMVREQVLGAATLPGTSLQLLCEVAYTLLQGIPSGVHSTLGNKCPLHQRVVWHAATLSAEETQAVLPLGALVQKTITVELDGRLILCSGVGTQPITRPQIHDLAAHLSLPRKSTKRCTLNPVTCDPVKEFEMLPGMVSPFLRPQRTTRLTALALLSWPRYWEELAYEVAISLSLWESVLLPLRCLKALLYGYARQAYPNLPVIELQPSAKDDFGKEIHDPRPLVGVTS